MGKGKKIKARSKHKVILKIKLKPLCFVNNVVTIAEITVFISVSIGIVGVVGVHFIC